MNSSRFSASILSRLSLLCERAEWDALAVYLTTLSNADFRTAGNLLGERVLEACQGEAFWQTFAAIVNINPKAFLVTCLKSVSRRYQAGLISFSSEALGLYAAKVVEEKQVIDRRKFLDTVLPLCATPEEVNDLLALFGLEEADERMAFLLKAESLPVYFVIFQTLRRNDADHKQIIHYCNLLKRKATRYAFNLVSIARIYFDISEITGCFSLQIEPYQLSRLDCSYQEFSRWMKSI